MFEPLVFVMLAVGLHVAVLTRAPAQDGANAAGAGGTELLSIKASDASVEAMVEDWSEPPDIEDLNVPALPQNFGFAAPSVAGLAVPSVHQTVDIDFAAMTPMPDALARLTPPAPDVATAPPEPNPPVQPQPDTRPPPPAARAIAAMAPNSVAVPEVPNQTVVAPPLPPPAPTPPATDASTLSSSARPVQRPDRPAQVAERPSEASQQTAKASSRSAPARSQQIAQGQGGGANAGSNASSESATISSAQESSLVARWGGRVRSQIERRKRYPKSARGASGVTSMEITIARTGQLLGVRVAKSSGNPALDTAALAAVRSVRAYAKAPKELRHAQMTFTLRIQFDD